MLAIDRVWRDGCWLDVGQFLQRARVAARGRGLHTCRQAAWRRVHRFVMSHIGAPHRELRVCGMWLGYAEGSVTAYRRVTEFEPVPGFPCVRR